MRRTVRTAPTGWCRATLQAGGGDFASGLAPRPDEGTVVTAVLSDASGQRAALLRYHRDGRPDRSFGAGGVVHTGLACLHDITLRADDRTRAAGSLIGSAFALVELRPSGRADRRFRPPWRRPAENGEGGYGNVLLVQPDGRPPLSGTVTGPRWGGATALRYLPWARTI